MQKKKYRRSNFRVESKEGRVLKYLRESRKLSMKKAGALIGRSDSFVCHCENGRADLTPTIISKFLNVYGYDYAHFYKIVQGEIDLPECDLEECIAMLKKMHKDKLKTVKSILKTF